MDDLKNKRVLVTGASTGIGAAAAKGLAAAGAIVGVNYNTSREAAEALVAEIRRAGGRAEPLPADLRSWAAAQALVAKAAEVLGGLDVLVNNAGHVLKRMSIKDVDEAFFDAIIDLNVRSMVAASQAALRIFLAQGRGNIINTTSVAARMGGGPGSALYAGSKGFVSTFTRNMAREFAAQNIRVNAVAPGVIMTPLHERLSPPEVMQGFLRTIPMQRIGEPDECTGAYLYLASDRLSGYVTGQVLEVNGGQLMV